MWLQLTYLTLAFQRITSYTRDPKISSSPSEWGGRGGSRVNTDGSHMWPRKRKLRLCIQTARRRSSGGGDTRHDWVCKYAQGVDVVLSVHAPSCIHPPQRGTAWGSRSANITLVTHVWWCLRALFSCCIILDVLRGFNTKLLDYRNNKKKTDNRFPVFCLVAA